MPEITPNPDERPEPTDFRTATDAEFTAALAEYGLSSRSIGSHTAQGDLAADLAQYGLRPRSTH